MVFPGEDSVQVRDITNELNQERVCTETKNVNFSPKKEIQVIETCISL